MKYFILFSVLLLSSCINSPKIVANKGAVYGVLSADAHPAFKKKMLDNGSSSSRYVKKGKQGINYLDNMVDYSNLSELYVGLISTDYKPQQHSLFANPEKMLPSSLALSVGDDIHIHNNTSSLQHFYISQIGGEGFQSFPELKAGQNAHFTLKLVGDLELLSEDNDKLKTVLFSKKNMLTKKLYSGQRYQFENLNPGTYQLIFWYWRLGKIEQSIIIKSQENINIDKTLSVDSVMHSN